MKPIQLKIKWRTHEARFAPSELRFKLCWLPHFDERSPQAHREHNFWVFTLGITTPPLLRTDLNVLLRAATNWFNDVGNGSVSLLTDDGAVIGMLEGPDLVELLRKNEAESAGDGLSLSDGILALVGANSALPMKGSVT